MDHYDLVVIGSGPAGEKGAAQAAYFGKRVALVEARADLGGACANTGTLPSKTLRETALYLSGLRQRDIYGLECSVRTKGLSVGDFMAHKDFVVRRENERIARNLDRHKVEVVRGRGRFVAPHQIAVGDRVLSAERILIATGSSPRRPPEIPFDDPDVDDSDEVLELAQIPASIIVIGGGVIGCEYASVFAGLGTTKVTLVEKAPRLLGFLDEELGDSMTQAFQRLGMEVILSDSVARYAKGPRGVVVTLASGRTLEADRLLAAAGRTGNTSGLGLAEVGIKLNDRQLVVVDEHMQTSVPGVYAAGDVIGWPSLASTSMEQGRVAICHAFDFPYKTKVGATLPYGLYTIPEASTVGETEAAARARGADVEVGRAYYRDNARGQIINDPEGMVKLVFEAKTQRLLGAHLLGERATELIHIAQVVITLGATIDYFIQTVFNYPTLAELYKYAAYDGLGRLAARPKT